MGAVMAGSVFFVHNKCQGECQKTQRRSKHQTAQQKRDWNGRVLEDKRWWNFTFDTFIFAHLRKAQNNSGNSYSRVSVLSSERDSDILKCCFSNFKLCNGGTNQDGCRRGQAQRQSKASLTPGQTTGSATWMRGRWEVLACMGREGDGLTSN